MVYGCVLLLIAPVIIPLIPELSDFPVSDLIALSSDMLYVLIVTFLIPSGFIIWFNSALQFWRRKNVAKADSWPDGTLMPKLEIQ